MSKTTNCTFTGHRSSKLPWRGNEDDPRCIELKKILYDAVEAVYQSGIRNYICGMANGADLYFCEAVLKLKESYADVTLEAAVPFEGQSAGWSRNEIEKYDHCLKSCDEINILSKSYYSGCFATRNKYMVDKSSVLIAVYNGRAGGTQNTLLYAMRQGLEIIELPVPQN